MIILPVSFDFYKLMFCGKAAIMEIERKFLVKELPDLTGTVMIRMEQR